MKHLPSNKQSELLTWSWMKLKVIMLMGRSRTNEYLLHDFYLQKILENANSSILAESRPGTCLGRRQGEGASKRDAIPWVQAPWWRCGCQQPETWCQKELPSSSHSSPSRWQRASSAPTGDGATFVTLRVDTQPSEVLSLTEALRAEVGRTGAGGRTDNLPPEHWEGRAEVAPSPARAPAPKYPIPMPWRNKTCPTSLD